MVGQSKNLDLIIKNLPSMKGIDEEFIPKFKFLQVKKSMIKSFKKGSEKTMICFIDISQKILYDTSKAEGEFLSLINSTISHEMRNPLNSIINQCKIVFSVCLNFKQLITTYSEYIDPQVHEKLNEIHDHVFKGNEIQTSSSNLLLLNVEDILGFAQLKAGKFTKIIKRFNIKRCIEDIISI
jgi:signal transduction histidine kinase